MIPEFRITYRLLDQTDERYRDLKCSSLDISHRIVSGDGSSSQPYTYEFRLANHADHDWRGVLHFELTVPSDEARFFLPAFMYGWNQGEKDMIMIPGSKLYPRLRHAPCDIPYSPYWMVRADRLSHPVTMMWANSFLYAISAPPWRMEDNQLKGFNGFSCALGTTSAIGFTLGYENAPWLYIDGQTNGPRTFDDANCFHLPAGTEYTFQMQVYVLECPEEAGMSAVVDDVYCRWHASPRQGADYKECISDIAEAIYHDCWLDVEHNYATMISIENGHIQRQLSTSISWTGGLEIAVPMLMAATRLNNDSYRLQALSCIQDIVDHSMNVNSGLPYESCNNGQWSVDGWWQSCLPLHGHSSYVVGQALYYILKGYDWEKKHSGVIHDDWLEFVRKVSDRIESTRDNQGEYPYVWSAEDGRSLEYDSFAGCWCLAARVYLAQLTGDAGMLPDCFKSEAHYYNKFVKHMECYATPIDTFRAVDSEGILAYIRVVRMLHEMTADALLLPRLRTALAYEFTFKFCYNVPIQVPPLSNIGWSSCGGSVTSTSNPHIHPMSSGIMDEMLYYSRLTGDHICTQRLLDVVSWNVQTYSRFDGEYDFGKKGWMSERFCYSEGLLMEKYPDGSPASTWFFFLPWGAANILEGMCGDTYELTKGGQA